MMNMLPSLKFSSKKTLHNVPVFSDLFSFDNNRFVFPFLTLPSPSHNRAYISSFFGIFRISYGCASARTIQSSLNSIFRHIELCFTNQTLFHYAVSFFQSSLFPESFCNIKCKTASAAEFLGISARSKFLFAV